MHDQLGKNGRQNISTFAFRHVDANERFICLAQIKFISIHTWGDRSRNTDGEKPASEVNLVCKAKNDQVAAILIQAGLNNVVLRTLSIVDHHIEQYCYTWFDLDSTTLFSIVDNH